MCPGGTARNWDRALQLGRQNKSKAKKMSKHARGAQKKSTGKEGQDEMAGSPGYNAAV